MTADHSAVQMLGLAISTKTVALHCLKFALGSVKSTSCTVAGEQHFSAQHAGRGVAPEAPKLPHIA